MSGLVRTTDFSIVGLFDCTKGAGDMSRGSRAVLSSGVGGGGPNVLYIGTVGVLLNNFGSKGVSVIAITTVGRWRNKF